MATTLNTENEIRKLWISDLKHLIRNIKTWSKTEGWEVKSSKRTVKEDYIGNYPVEELIILLPGEGRVHVEVMGRGNEKTAGKVEVFAWPTLFRVILIQKNHQWLIKTDSGITISSVDKNSFRKIVIDLIGAD